MAEQEEKKEGQPLKDWEGGYGGGRNRAEQTPDHAFGEHGFSEGRGHGDARQSDSGGEHEPKGVADTGSGGPGWQERFTAENADKFGQAGGQPTTGRGPSHSAGGREHEEADIGSAEQISPRGGVGIRETEKQPGTPKPKE